MGVLKGLVKKGLGEMGFNAEGGVINWFPGHMAAATRAIRSRLKLADLVIEVRDSRVRTYFHTQILSVCVVLFLKFELFSVLNRFLYPPHIKIYSLSSPPNAV